ncbi:NIPSNAP family protein [Variovorax sp. PCZ-1]|uniref:NIPSNAP family protein n=1 Tax=Variovorax sp. PCZ-1 TaxID=2835533 RepID=UPI001BCF9CBE|nr:NIPSNAP family protein [Variovorax sp. PCZ-1]MBS7808857.1 NIPSNAP family protein [Variovorax sp. PCZ-1]
MSHLLEIRTYRLKPGTLEAFHEAMHNLAVPMIRSAGMDVVAYGKSDHEEETYFLIRAYKNREALEAEQAAFYGSSRWREGPRAALVDRIETYVNTLVWLSAQGVEDLRTNNAS